MKRSKKYDDLVDALRAVVTYATHVDTGLLICPAPAGGKCTCGLDDKLARLRAVEQSS